MPDEGANRDELLKRVDQTAEDKESLLNQVEALHAQAERIKSEQSRREFLAHCGKAITISGTLANTLFSGAATAIVVEAYHARWAARETLARSWLSHLGLGPRVTFFCSDDYSLYPSVNKYSTISTYKGRRIDPRGVLLHSSLSAFVSQIEHSTVGMQPFDLPYHSAHVPPSMVIAGSSLNNRAARAMVGHPIQERKCPLIFDSLDRTWRAELVIGQYTPIRAMRSPIVARYESNEEWVFWDQVVQVSPDHQETSKFDSKQPHPTHPRNCYFHITKLRSPIPERQQSIVFMIGLHWLGIEALNQLFRVPLDSAAAEFINTVINKTKRYASWQSVACVSDFYLDNGVFHAGRIHEMNTVELPNVYRRKH
jgi:hypothetical protein